MSGKTKERGDAAVDEKGDSAVPHPLDRWLQRELQALYSDPAGEPLPPDIAELAEKLEEKLKGPGVRDKKRGDE